MRYAQGNPSGMYEISVNDSLYARSWQSTSDWTNYTYDTIETKLNTGFNNTIKITAQDNNAGVVDAIIIGKRLDAPGFRDNELINSITAYPNPFNSVINIEVESEQNISCSVKIINILGQTVEVSPIIQNTGNKSIFQWNASGFKSGIYYATVYQDELPYKTVKLMLKR